MILKYGTIVSFLFQYLYYKNIIKQSSSILFSILNISIYGLYITYIHPKQLYIPEFNITFKGKALILCDLLTHQLPLLYYIYYHYYNKIFYKKDNLLLALYIIILYFYINDISQIYGVKLYNTYQIIFFNLLLVKIINIFLLP